jgi:aminopeptidase-like protein
MSRSRWQKALAKLADRNRTHVNSDTSAAYRDLAEIYGDCEVIGFPSGAEESYWVVPPAWEVDGATLRGPDGKVIADWNSHKLSLYIYSPPYKGSVTLDELQRHLFSIPAKPDRIPFHFRNQYRHWDPEWGFCLTDKARKALKPGTYDVDIATRFEPGTMEMVEQCHAGELADSILLVGHFDHPAMCNDGLVGCIAGHEIVSRLKGRKTRFTYRMLSTVEIIGSVFYAAHHAPGRNVRHALFIATAGARAPINYQQSFSGTSPIDRAMRHVFRHFVSPAERDNIQDFRMGPLGNDEIAFDVGGPNIPCGVLLRGPFDQYHTDADNIDAVDPDRFEEEVELALAAINVIEKNATLKRRFNGLPCLSNPKLNLYLAPAMISNVRATDGGHPAFENCSDMSRRAIAENPDALHHMHEVLPAMCEGNFTVLDVAERAGLPFEVVDIYTDLWVEHGLLEKTWVNPFAG